MFFQFKYLLLSLLIVGSSVQSSAQTDSIININDLFQLADKDEMYGLDRNVKNPNQLDNVYYFNKQIFFTVKLDGRVVNSYFYLNTKKGYSLLDKDFFFKIDPASSIDAHITFPENKEYFLYFKDIQSNIKYSKISKTSIPLGPDFLEAPDELLRHFKDWFSPVSGGTEFLGENGRLKSDAFTGAFNGADITIYLSRETPTTIQNNFCVGWLGLGYVRLDGEFTTLITRVMSAWSSYQIDLMVEKDVNFIFDGSLYQSVQAKMNEVTTNIDQSIQQIQQQTEQKSARTEDVTEKELIEKLAAAKMKKLNAGNNSIKSIEAEQGKVEDFYSLMNAQIGNPLDDIDIFEAEIHLKIFQINKRLGRETNATKRNAMNQELAALNALKGKLNTYRQKFEQIKASHSGDPARLMKENSALYQIMMRDLATGN